MTIAVPPVPQVPTVSQSPVVEAAQSGANGPSIGGTSFMDQLGQAIDSLQQSMTTSNVQALQVASGQGNLADYMVSAEQANLRAELTDTIAQKATAAFTMIMDMQI